MAEKLREDLARNGLYGISESGAPGKGPARARGNETSEEAEATGEDQGTAPPVDTFLRLAAVMKATGLGRSTIYELVAAGLFPRPVKISANGKAVGWPASEVAQYQRDRMAARGAPPR